MKKNLHVYLNDQIVGHLFLDTNGQMIFKYEEDWLNNPDAMPVSHSLPLQEGLFRHKISSGFFSGLLPEESKRELVARNLGISQYNDYAMLEAIGGECAGAVTFIPYGDSLESHPPSYQRVTDLEMKNLLTIVRQQPLLAGYDHVRLSLAGAQDKMSVYFDGHHVAIPIDGSPSTHIVKPKSDRFPGLVFNEAFCMQLAAIVGLEVAKAEIHSIDDVEFLMIERYDRYKAGGVIKRIHQEDFCQALGIQSQHKYQNEGGPSLKSSFNLLREVSSQPVIDLAKLLEAVIFNLLIGNHDAHGKNFSLLYEKKHARLAPLYDLVSTVYYPQLTKKMAMKIGKEPESDNILQKHLEVFSAEVGLAKQTVSKRFVEFTSLVQSRLDDVELRDPVSNGLRTLINERCARYLSRFQSH